MIAYIPIIEEWDSVIEFAKSNKIAILKKDTFIEFTSFALMRFIHTLEVGHITTYSNSYSIISYTEKKSKVKK